MMEKLQQKARNKKIWASLDETTDASKRSIANFVFGVLDDDDQRQNCYLVNLAVFEACNASTIAEFSIAVYPNGLYIFLYCSKCLPSLHSIAILAYKVTYLYFVIYK